MLELIIALGILVGAAAYIGKPQPDPMRQCAIACGEDNMKSYNITYGKCECKNKEID